MERKKYHSHREKSRSSHEKFLTIIVDGMDQSKTNLPNTKLISKSTSALWHLCTHVMGVILHTKAPSGGKMVYSFVDLIQYPHDSNLTITVLINVLIDFAKTNSMPEVLYTIYKWTIHAEKTRTSMCLLFVQFLFILESSVRYVMKLIHTYRLIRHVQKRHTYIHLI